MFQSSFKFPHSLTWLYIKCILSSVALPFPEFLSLFSLFFLFHFFFCVLTPLFPFISQLHHCDDFLNILWHFPPFLLLLLFIPLLLSPAILIRRFFFPILQISSSVSSNSSSFLLFQSSLPHSLAGLHLIYHQLLFLSLIYIFFLSFFLFFHFFLFPHSPFPLHIPITPLWWFPQYPWHFPPFLLSIPLFFSFLHLVSLHSSSFPLFQCQPSFPHSSFITFAWFKFIIPMLFHCNMFLNFLLFFFFCFFSSSSLSSSLFSSFSFLPLLFLLPSSFLISQCDDFLNLHCHFLGAVLPAPALYPSLLSSILRITAQSYIRKWVKLSSKKIQPFLFSWHCFVHKSMGQFKA